MPVQVMWVEYVTITFLKLWTLREYVPFDKKKSIFHFTTVNEWHLKKKSFNLRRLKCDNWIMRADFTLHEWRRAPSLRNFPLLNFSTKTSSLALLNNIRLKQVSLLWHKWCKTGKYNFEKKLRLWFSKQKRKQKNR